MSVHRASLQLLARKWAMQRSGQGRSKATREVMVRLVDGELAAGQFLDLAGAVRGPLIWEDLSGGQAGEPRLGNWLWRRAEGSARVDLVRKRARGVLEPGLGALKSLERLPIRGRTLALLRAEGPSEESLASALKRLQIPLDDVVSDLARLHALGLYRLRPAREATEEIADDSTESADVQDLRHLLEREEAQLDRPDDWSVLGLPPTATPKDVDQRVLELLERFREIKERTGVPPDLVASAQALHDQVLQVGNRVRSGRARVTRVSRDPEGAFNRAMAELEEGNRAGAARLLRFAVGEDPRPQWMSWAGYADWHDPSRSPSQRRAGREQCEAVLAQHTELPTALYVLAILDEEDGKVELAVRQYQLLHKLGFKDASRRLVKLERL